MSAATATTSNAITKDDIVASLTNSLMAILSNIKDIHPKKKHISTDINILIYCLKTLKLLFA